MNQELEEEIKNHIADYKQRLALFDEYVHADVRKEHFGGLNTSIEGVMSFFDEILQDIDDFDIPDLYQGVLRGFIDNFSISLLPKNKEELDRLSNNTPMITGVSNVISTLPSLENQRNGYLFYKSIGFASKNVVVVGANGSGKSTLANTIKDTLKRQDGIVIPAQKLILLPTLTYIPALSSIAPSFAQSQKTIFNSKVTYSLNNNSDVPYDVVRQQSAHVRDLFIMLSAERANANAKCGNMVRNGSAPTKEDAASTIDTVIEIWNELIEHRKLVCNDNNELVISYEGQEYPAYQMSDGERLILYLVAEVKLAPSKALIVVDEPELHLHKAILDKLWNKLEALRSDCLFFYLTHDLHFATSRDAIKCWIKSYNPHAQNKWEIKRVEDNELPQGLLLKLLGSRKKILFCEGEFNSIDYKLYSQLFPKFTVTPVVSCKNVINYTRAFNKLSDRYADAYGLIDRDFKSQKELDSLKSDKIYSYDVAEVENVLLQEDLLRQMDAQMMGHSDIEALKQEIIDKLDSDKEQQVSRYVEHQISSCLSQINGMKGGSIDEVKNNYKEELGKITPDVWYNERVSVIKKLVENKDYLGVLKVYNNKGLVGIVEKKLSIRHYYERALEMFSKDGVPQSIKNLYPQELQ